MLKEKLKQITSTVVALLTEILIITAGVLLALSILAIRQ